MRPVLVGNPDITAPHPDEFTAEPAYWMARAMQQIPFGQSGLASRIRWPLHWPINVCVSAGRQLDKSRIAMVGDSLHTDILGGLVPLDCALFW